MEGDCCQGRPVSNRLLLWISAAAGSMVPGVFLALLPKCPLCVAAWLAILFGASLSPATVELMRWTAMSLWISALVCTGAFLAWRYRFRRERTS